MALSACRAQSKRLSLIEAITNTVVAYILAVATQFAVFRAFGLRVGVVQNLGLGLMFTAVSQAVDTSFACSSTAGSYDTAPTVDGTLMCCKNVAVGE